MSATGSEKNAAALSSANEDVEAAESATTAPDNIPSYKLLLLGDVAVGKTALVKRLLTAKMEEDYTATEGVQVTPLDFYTSRGPLRFDVWDTAGHEKFASLRDGYYAQGHCAILMFDVMAMRTYRNVTNWHGDLVRICPNIPIVLCGNKIDMDRKVKSGFVDFHQDKEMEYVEMSVMSNVRCKEPFLHLARRLTGDPALEFVPRPRPYRLPDAEIEARAKKARSKYEEMTRSYGIDLPADGSMICPGRGETVSGSGDEDGAWS